MKILFNEYPKCSTCQKAKKWLDSHKIEYDDRHIVENNPTKEELKLWIAKSNKQRNFLTLAECCIGKWN